MLSEHAEPPGALFHIPRRQRSHERTLYPSNQTDEDSQVSFSTDIECPSDLLIVP